MYIPFHRCSCLCSTHTAWTHDGKDTHVSKCALDPFTFNFRTLYIRASNVLASSDNSLQGTNSDAGLLDSVENLPDLAGASNPSDGVEISNSSASAAGALGSAESEGGSKSGSRRNDGSVEAL